MWCVWRWSPCHASSSALCFRTEKKQSTVRSQFKKATEGISSAEGVVIDTKAEVCATLNQAVSLLRAHEN